MCLILFAFLSRILNKRQFDADVFYSFLNDFQILYTYSRSFCFCLLQLLQQQKLYRKWSAWDTLGWCWWCLSFSSRCIAIMRHQDRNRTICLRHCWSSIACIPPLLDLGKRKNHTHTILYIYIYILPNK